MPQRLPIRHLRTFARLHSATATEAEALAALEHRAAPAAASRLDWQRLIASPAVTVIVAREGDCLVGAAVTVQRRRGVTARLLWLGVCPSGRGRGIGTLLLGTVSSTARDNGAAIVVAESPAPDTDAMPQLLRSQGFQRRGGEEASRFERALWQGPEASPLSNQRSHCFSDGARPAVCALMMALGSLDPALLLTPLLEAVLGEEFEVALARNPHRMGAALAEVATAHGYVARASRRPVLSLAGLDGTPPVTPEELVACLELGQVPLLAIRIPRLDGGGQRRWLLVAGFDGELFRLADPRLPVETVEVATRGELRTALAAFEAVVLGRPAAGGLPLSALMESHDA